MIEGDRQQRCRTPTGVATNAMVDAFGRRVSSSNVSALPVLCATRGEETHGESFATPPGGDDPVRAVAVLPAWETAMNERIDDLKFLVTIGFVTILGTCLTALVG